MPNEDYGQKPYGLIAVSIYPLPSGAGVALPVQRVLKFKEVVQSGQLRGGGGIAAVQTTADAVEWELEGGGISLEAYATLTGRTVTTSGTTPNRIRHLTGDAGQNFPYVIIRGKALDDAIGDAWCVIWKAKITDALSGDFADGQFFITSCKGIGIDDGVNGIWEFYQHETATSLPA
jgi:hypothetical protein